MLLLHSVLSNWFSQEAVSLQKYWYRSGRRTVENLFRAPFSTACPGSILLLTGWYFSHLLHLPPLGLTSPCTCCYRILPSMAFQHFIFWWIVGFLSFQRKAPTVTEFSLQVQNRTEEALIYLNGLWRLTLPSVWGAWSPHADFCLWFHDFWLVKEDFCPSCSDL